MPPVVPLHDFATAEDFSAYVKHHYSAQLRLLHVPRTLLGRTLLLGVLTLLALHWRVGVVALALSVPVVLQDLYSHYHAQHGVVKEAMRLCLSSEASTWKDLPAWVGSSPVATPPLRRYVTTHLEGSSLEAFDALAPVSAMPLDDFMRMCRLA